jgi:hypothetical protein
VAGSSEGGQFVWTAILASLGTVDVVYWEPFSQPVASHVSNIE